MSDPNHGSDLPEPEGLDELADLEATVKMGGPAAPARGQLAEARPAPDSTPLPERVADLAGCLRGELGKVIVGQQDVIELLLVALLARGHGLFQGVPGLAKTLLISSLAEATDCSFSRVQFTPDLMPTDITGTEVLQEDRSTGRRETVFLPGPVFANLVLADEINRTPPKTQAALLEAMQEQKITAGGHDHALPQPFLVFATQNPVEQEGTYPLPEAQLDRFMLMVHVDYPSAEEEEEIVLRTTAAPPTPILALVHPEELLQLQRAVRDVPVGPEIIKLAVELVRASRPDDSSPDFIADWVSWGAGPRASQYLILAGKARALLHGRSTVSRADVHALARPVLRHRILLNFRAEAENVSADSIVDRLLAHVDPTVEL